MGLDSIVGQSLAVSILRRGLETNTLSHAYLFHGDAGLGKETTARAVADELIKQGGIYSQFRVIEGTPSIKIEQIRLLKEQSEYSQNGNLVWLIKDVDNMTPQAANAFLKTLEEPVKGVYFFLTTTSLHSLLPTIVSRCQLIPFRSISEDVIRDYLAEKTGVDREDVKVRLAARMARGSIGRAIEYWDGPVLEHRREVLDRLSQIPILSFPEVLGMSQNWNEDRQQVLMDLQLMLEWYRDLAAIKSGVDIPLYNPDYENELTEISADYSYRSLFRIIQEISEMVSAIQGNARVRFCIGYLLLMMKKGALA
ncbi:MAG: AAA family ATPase [Firmicutes bacterium]|nr:AAA family ATPase [Bacillota bacterium]